MKRLKVLVAEDYALVREGLCGLINSQPDMEVIGEAADGERAWQLARELRPDIVVMDVSMPRLSGAQCTERIRAACPSVKILALSAHEDEAHVRLLLASGASGYLLKKATGQELVGAIRAVVRGEFFMDPALQGRFGQDHHQGALAPENSQQLTPREIEIMLLVAWGYTNKEIAEKLHLSVKTVEGHKAKAGLKIGESTRAGMVRYTLKQGWLWHE